MDLRGDKTGRTWALDVHEVRVWRLHKSLELVPLLFGFLGGVKEIDGERLHQTVSASLARQIPWTMMLTMTARKDAGGDGTQGFLWIGESKVSEFEL